MKTSRKKLLLLSGVISLCLLSSVFCFQLWIQRGSNDVGSEIKVPVQAVLRANFWSDINGEYLENEILKQSKLVKNMSLKNRLEFYRAILMYCDLKNYRAIYFAEIVGNDSESLLKHLVAYKGEATFNNLTADQRTNVENWINELPILLEQQDHDAHIEKRKDISDAK